MKLRQRVAICTFIGVILIILFVNFVFYDGQFSIDPNNVIGDSLAKRSRLDFFAGKGSGRAHLNILRKDLDKSNFTSGEDGSNKVYNGNNHEKETTTKARNPYFKFVVTVQDKDFFERLEENDGNIADDKLIEIKIDEHFFNYQQMTIEGIRKKIATFRKKSRDKGKRINIISSEAIEGDGKPLTSWERFYMGISQYEIYQDENKAVDDLIHDMATLNMVDAVQKKGGTQIKLIVSFNNDGQALFKPQRHGRKYVTNPNHFYFSDFERHTSEIASFHLDRILGNRWVPPVAGRLVNSSREIRDVCDSKLLKTFFISPAGNLCFYGKCTYYCDTAHAVCAKNGMVEGSMMAFLPPSSVVPRSEWENPWRRSYSKWKKADWEENPHYCRREVLTDEMYSLKSKTKRKRILDVMDMTIFDFFTGNMDRHHYNTIEMFDNDTTPFLWDNGRGFGKPDEDEMSIIVPVMQCCLIRHSTFQKLIVFHTGPFPLSALMRTSLKNDKINVIPILPENHLEALDRRVGITLKIIRGCIVKKGLKKVVIDDGF